MSEHQHRCIAYLLEDVMKNKFNKAFYQEDLWKYVENKKIQEYDMKDVKHWIYAPCWSYNLDNTDCFYSIYQALIQKKKFKDDIKRIKKADTSYPLIVYKMNLIGNHRFANIYQKKNLINYRLKYEFFYNI